MNRMTASETDVMDPENIEVVAEQIEGIAGGIMDLLDNPDPNHSAQVAPRPATPEEQQAAPPEEEEAPAPEKEVPSEEPEVEKYTIKWQGQEKELSHDELISLAQQGFDYRQKTQRLAEERDQIAPYVGLAKRIQADPNLAKTIANLLSGQQQQAEQMPDDPIERLKAEIRQELRQELEPVQRQQAINAFKAEVQRDPDYKVVHQQILSHIAAQPPSLRRTMYLQLDQDPRSYMEMFTHFKQQNTQENITTDAEPEKEKPKPNEVHIVKKVTKAPFLSAGGAADTTPVAATSRQKLNKQKAEALRSGDPLMIAKWLESSGAIDHLM